MAQGAAYRGFIETACPISPVSLGARPLVHTSPRPRAGSLSLSVRISRSCSSTRPACSGRSGPGVHPRAVTHSLTPASGAAQPGLYRDRLPDLDLGARRETCTRRRGDRCLEQAGFVRMPVAARRLAQAAPAAPARGCPASRSCVRARHNRGFIETACPISPADLGARPERAHVAAATAAPSMRASCGCPWLPGDSPRPLRPRGCPPSRCCVRGPHRRG